MGIAATGSGKTLAFVLPALMHIKAQAPAAAHEVITLVLAPTRELAMQSAEVATTAGAPCKVRSVCIYGAPTRRPLSHPQPTRGAKSTLPPRQVARRKGRSARRSTRAPRSWWPRRGGCKTLWKRAL